MGCRLLTWLILAMLLSAAAPITARAQFAPLPTGWKTDHSDDQLFWFSPSNASGAVNVYATLPAPVDGAFDTVFPVFAAATAEGIAGPITKSGNVAYLERRKELGSYIGIETSGTAGFPVALDFYARPLNWITQQPADANKMALVLVIAPLGLKQAAPSADTRWRDASRFAGRMIAWGGLALTPELIARIRQTDAASAAPEAPAVATVPQNAPSEILWSARGYGNGVALVSPCSADGVAVVGALRRREYLAMVNLPSYLVDEALTSIRAWSGGGGSTGFTPVRQDGNLLTMTAEFNTPAGRMFGWFAAMKRSDNYVQRAYVIAPAALANDRRVASAASAIREMLVQQNYGELAQEGEAPAPAQSTALLGVYAFPGLAFLLDDRRVSTRSVEIAIFANGGATETSGNMVGAWRRVGGGYSIEFAGGQGYIARVSETCRTPATTASRPAPLAPAPASGRTCFSSPITLNHPRAISVEKCSFIGGQRQCRYETEWRDSLTTVHGC